MVHQFHFHFLEGGRNLAIVLFFEPIAFFQELSSSNRGLPLGFAVLHVALEVMK